jgi:ribosomal protein S18 acetylase RimI-like enzyme
MWAPPPLPIDEEDWSRAWLAVSASKIAGMVLTHEEWVSDLWVLREHRNRGIGRQLLFHGEAEIAGRGQFTARLRVVKSNVRAVSFYKRFGWNVEREFIHETLPTCMLEMSKRLERF